MIGGVIFATAFLVRKQVASPGDFGGRDGGRSTLSPLRSLSKAGLGGATGSLGPGSFANRAN